MDSEANCEASSQAELELYDYQLDPEEMKNLAADQPEVVASLRSILAAYLEAIKPGEPAARQPK